MIKSARSYQISELLNPERPFIYKIPRYQREYTSGKNECETLFDDLDENKSGYFLGSFICINESKDSMENQTLELVDGQQRFTTISLLLAAIYETLSCHEIDLDDEQNNKRFYLKRKLAFQNGDMRLELQTQGNNRDDYRAILSGINIIDIVYSPPKFAGNRLIFRAHRYFKKRIDQMVNDQGCRLNKVMDFLKKVNEACLVKIEVETIADAYTLFESLNNRGIPLTPIDMIKNRLLSNLETNLEINLIDSCYQQWGELLNYLEDDYQIQERFFRHYYNAFRNTLPRINDARTVAKRSNLIGIYIELIREDTYSRLQDIVDAGKTYSRILSNNQHGIPDELDKLFKDLRKIQGAPSYVLLIYLLKKKDGLNLTNRHLESIVRRVIHFFVRRNLTDTPPTRDLDRLFMDMIDEINGHVADAIPQLIWEKLVNVSATDDVFKDKLRGSIFTENKSVARFILNKLAERGMTNENMVDVWDTKVWTIEHIFPQGENIPPSWVNMMAQGDDELAKEYQQEHVHKLGNLTITGNNSKLGTLSFEEKRDLKDNEGNKIGYGNGLLLNEKLATTDRWSVEQINSRTNTLIDEVTEIFSLSE